MIVKYRRPDPFIIVCDRTTAVTARFGIKEMGHSGNIIIILHNPSHIVPKGFYVANVTYAEAGEGLDEAI